MLKTKIPTITFCSVQNDHLKTDSISVTRELEKNIELTWFLKNIHGLSHLFSCITLLNYTQITSMYNAGCPPLPV